MLTKKILLGLLVIYAQNIYCQVKNNKDTKIDISDSLSVLAFLKNTNICERLNYVEKNKSVFICDQGYSEMILKNICKESHSSIFLPVSNGGIRLTKKNKEDALQEQLDEIKLACNCNDVSDTTLSGQDKVLLKYISFRNSATISTPCDSFENQYGKSIHERDCLSKDTIASLGNFLKKVVYINDDVEKIDVKAKFYLAKGKALHVICINQFNIMIDGRPIKKDEQFYKYLLSMIPNEYLLPFFWHK
jgi:hypothetical protein